MSQPRPNYRTSRPTMRVALVAVFTALSLGTNYAMIDIPNVKLMDALVFIAGFFFGLEVGVGSAVSIWMVYGFINPYGQADPTLLLFLSTGECFYAIAGFLLSRVAAVRDLVSKARAYRQVSLRFGLVDARMSLLFGLVGFQATFAYDVLTNFGSWIFKTSSLYQALVVGLITGVPFAIIHEVTNLGFFATVVPWAIIASGRMGLPHHNSLR